jgi:hypothetical protein
MNLQHFYGRSVYEHFNAPRAATNCAIRRAVDLIFRRSFFKNEWGDFFIKCWQLFSQFVEIKKNLLLV